MTQHFCYPTRTVASSKLLLWLSDKQSARGAPMSNVLLPMDTRRQLLRALKTRYQAASKAEKTRILEEFILISGYHRKWGPLGKRKISYAKPVFKAGMTGSIERKAEVKWLDVSIDLQRSNPMRQLYICKMLFLNDKRQAVTSSGNGHVQLVSRFLRFIFIEHAKVATQILEMFLR